MLTAQPMPAVRPRPGRPGHPGRPGIGPIVAYMPKGGTLSPKGDLGALRQEESEKVGGFKNGSIVKASAKLRK